MKDLIATWLYGFYGFGLILCSPVRSTNNKQDTRSCNCPPGDHTVMVSLIVLLVVTIVFYYFDIRS